MNMYAYVGNDPVNATDPTGLVTCPGSRLNQSSCTGTPTRYSIGGPPGSGIFGGGGGGGGGSGGGTPTVCVDGACTVDASAHTGAVPGTSGSSEWKTDDHIVVTAGRRAATYTYFPLSGLLTIAFIGGDRLDRQSSGSGISGRAPTGEELRVINSGVVQSAISEAWARSNPSGPESQRREVGFWIAINYVGLNSFNVYISPYIEGPLGKPIIDLGSPPSFSSYKTVFSVHTHPFEGYAGLHDNDETLAFSRGLAGIIIANKQGL